MSGHLSIESLNPVTTILGGQFFARFGYSIKFLDANGDGVDDLIIGEPYHTESTWLVPADDVGAVYGFLGGPQFPKGQVTYAQATRKFINKRKQSKFGWDFTSGKVDLGSFAFIVSAPRSSRNFAHEGILVSCFCNCCKVLFLKFMSKEINRLGR